MVLRKFTSALALVLVCTLLFASCSLFKKASDKETGADSTPVTAPFEGKEIGDLSQVIAQTANYRIDAAIMTYFFYSVYSNYSNYATTLGIDTSKDLREQTPSASSYTMITGEELPEGMTWFKFFYDAAKDQLATYVAFAEKAKADGFTLTESDAGEIDSYIASLDSYAAQYGCENADEFINGYIAPGLTKDKLRECVELEQLGYLYYNKLAGELTVTDDEIDTYFAENKTDFLTADMFCYDLDIALEGNTEEEKKENLDKLNAEMEALATNIKTADDMKNLINSRERKDGEDDKDYSANYGDTGVYKNEISPEIGDWVFGEERRDNDFKLFSGSDDDGCALYSFVFVVKAPYLNEGITKNVRHILFLSEGHTDAAGARKAAEELLAEMQKSEITEESFAAMANEKSEDPGSNTNGGLYENVYVGQMVKEFESWTFDETRKVGDVGIVDTSYGSHIMFFAGEGEPQWRSDVKSAALGKKSQALIDDSVKELALSVDDTKSSLIP